MKDPIDSLINFYDQCHTAPIPPSLVEYPTKSPWWLRAAIPAIGLSFGALIAILMVVSPTAPSVKAGAQAARAISRQQIKAVQQDTDENHASKTRARKWTA